MFILDVRWCLFNILTQMFILDVRWNWFHFFFFFDTALLYSLSRPATCYVDRFGFKLTEPHLPLLPKY